MASREYFRVYREKNRSRIRDNKRRWAKDNPDRERKYSADQLAKNPHKQVLRRIARKAGLGSGVCANCGRNPGKGANGRTLLQHHHVGYGASAKTQLLCPSCHGKKRLK